MKKILRLFIPILCVLFALGSMPETVAALSGSFRGDSVLDSVLGSADFLPDRPAPPSGTLFNRSAMRLPESQTWPWQLRRRLPGRLKIRLLKQRKNRTEPTGNRQKT